MQLVGILVVVTTVDDATAMLSEVPMSMEKDSLFGSMGAELERAWAEALTGPAAASRPATTARVTSGPLGVMRDMTFPFREVGAGRGYDPRTARQVGCLGRARAARLTLSTTVVVNVSSVRRPVRLTFAAILRYHQ